MHTCQNRKWSQDVVAMAIGRDEFIPFFQPKMDLATGMSSCVEMLARWDHPELGILPPIQFIHLIERAGLIDDFTNKLFRKSLVVAANNCRLTGKKTGIAVNFSLLTLQSMQASRRICSMAKEYGVANDRITIEVTENAAPENLGSAIRTLTALRSQGFLISIDDFGTGYSSLKLLSKIPFTELKIDRMFVAGISRNKKLTLILESIVNLAKKLDVNIVAEGVETKVQLDFIRSLGCNLAQGFYVGMPTRDIGGMCHVDQPRIAFA